MKALVILKNGIKLMEEAIEKNPLCTMELTSEIMIYEEAIAELETHDNCGSCKWYLDKRCKNPFGIAFNGDNAVYKDDYCSDYEAKESE